MEKGVVASSSSSATATAGEATTGEPHWLAHEVRSGARAARAQLALRDAKNESSSPRRARASPPSRTGGRIVRQGGDGAFTLLHGDLHPAYEDLSLCFPFYDGSLDDAYRYARGALARSTSSRSPTTPATSTGGTSAACPGPLHARGRPSPRARPLRRVLLLRAQSGGHRPRRHLPRRGRAPRPHQHRPCEPSGRLTPGTASSRSRTRRVTPPARASANVWTRSATTIGGRGVPVLPGRGVLRRGDREGPRGRPSRGFIASSDHLSTFGAYACVWARVRRGSHRPRAHLRGPARAADLRRDGEGRGGCAVGRRSMGRAGGRRSVPDLRRGPRRRAGRARRVLGERCSGPHCRAAAEGRAVWEWPGAPEDTFGWCSVVVRFEDGERAWASPFFARWDRAGAEARAAARPAPDQPP